MRNASGEVLFTRFFDSAISSESVGDAVQGSPIFAELVPVQDAAARIVIIDGSGRHFAPLPSVDRPPVDYSLPAGSETWAGNHVISWLASDSDSTVLTFLIQYSADGGGNWHNLMRGLKETSLAVNFDDLPGSTGSFLIRVYASDGVNTGVAASQSFSVTKNLPTARILFPGEASVFQPGSLVWFQGLGFRFL